MDKNVGFIRTLELPWLDAAAGLCAETVDPVILRARLDALLVHQIGGAEARRKAIDVLISIWMRSAEVSPALRAQAVAYFQETASPADRLWLHYGLSLLRFPFFRECAAALGHFSRLEQPITTRLIKERMTSERGQLGDIKRSTERIVSSLRRWGILVDSGRRNVYLLPRQAFPASKPDLELWMLACALHAHPAEELPFADLLHLPELVPFRFTVTVDNLRRAPSFAVQRQGSGWDSVRLDGQP